MYSKDIVFFGKKVSVYCDGKCHKAWGICSRPVKDDISDGSRCFLADGEVGDAPDDPGTYEGECGKPWDIVDEKMNKWCVRECERCVIKPFGEKPTEEELNKFETRQSIY